MNKIVVCPDSFKGSLSAVEVASVIERALRKRWNDTEIITLPLADGGEGTSEVLGSKYPVKRQLKSFDSLKRPINAYYLIDKTGKSALIESATVLGLSLLKLSERNPLNASSFGLGILIKDAIEKGCEEISVSLGGSAVCDGGMGMLEALGVRFVNQDGNYLKGNGANLQHISAIDSSNIFKGVNQVHFNAICDVVNPLYGSDGAAFVFAPQKGASYEDVIILDNGLINLAKHVTDLCSKKENPAFSKGAGAAGGLGFALSAFLNAECMSGIDLLLDIFGFDKIIEGADYIITGEGKIDKQSLMGKVLKGVLERARSKNIPVIALGGTVEDEVDLLSVGQMKAISISDSNLSLSENMVKNQTIINLQRAIDREDLFETDD